MTQNDMVLNALKKGSLTSKEAASRLNIWRLASRINDLRNMGHDIRTDMVGEKARYARYTLVRLRTSKAGRANLS